MEDGQEKVIRIYTDGAARGNPGPGGLGIVLLMGKHRKEYAEGYRRTTNNRMELLAVVRALELLKTNAYPVEVYSDSKYVVDAITKGWLTNWVRTDFKQKKNRDLWEKYLKVAKPFAIRFFWVKGHANNPENNRCDELAVWASKQPGLPADVPFESENP